MQRLIRVAVLVFVVVARNLRSDFLRVDVVGDGFGSRDGRDAGAGSEDKNAIRCHFVLCLWFGVARFRNEKDLHRM